MGDSCHWSHSIFEHWLHPSRYKTRLCSFGRNCNRPICFFAHHNNELRIVGGPDENPKDLDEREYLLQLVLAQESGMLPFSSHPGSNSMMQQQQGASSSQAKKPYSQSLSSFLPSGSSTQGHSSSNYPHLYPPGVGGQQQASQNTPWSGYPSSSSGMIHNNQNVVGTSSSYHQQQQQQQAVGMGDGEVDTASMLLGLQDTFNGMSLLDATQWPVGAVSGVPHNRISDPGHIPRPPPQPIGPTTNYGPKAGNPGSYMMMPQGRGSFGGAVSNLNYSFLGPSAGFDLGDFQQQAPLHHQRASVSEGGDSLNLGIPGLEDLLPMVLRQIQSGEWEGLGIKTPQDASESNHMPMGLPPKPFSSASPNTNSYQGPANPGLMLDIPSFSSGSGETVSARSSANVDHGSIPPVSGTVNHNTDLSKRSSCDERVMPVVPSYSSSSSAPQVPLGGGGGGGGGGNVGSAADALVGKLVHQLQEQGGGSKEQLVASLSQILAQLLEPSKAISSIKE